MVALVAHTSGLSIEQGTQGVGRTEDVGTWTLTVWTLVGFWTHTNLLFAAEGIARTVLVLLARLDVQTL